MESVNNPDLARRKDSIELIHVLKAGAHYDTRWQRRFRLFAAILLVFAVMLLQLFIVDAMSFDRLLDRQAWAEIAEKLWTGVSKLYDDPLDQAVVAMAIVGFPLFLFGMWVQGDPRLVIDKEGIRKVGAGRDEIFGKALNWAIAAPEIESITLAGQSTELFTQIARIIIRSRDGTLRTLALNQWLDSEKKERQSTWSHLKLVKARTLNRRNLELPLFKALTYFGYDVILPDPPKKNDVLAFDLSKNKASLFSVVIVLCFLLYAIAGYITPGETYVAGHPYGLFGIVGIVVGAVVCAINLAAQVPNVIAAGIGFVAALTSAAGAYPGLLRVNRVMDANDLQLVQYVHQAGYQYRALDSRWPDIEIPSKVHWGKLDPKKPLTVPIRQGGLGFYQANFRSLINKAPRDGLSGEPE